MGFLVNWTVKYRVLGIYIFFFPFLQMFYGYFWSQGVQKIDIFPKNILDKLSSVRQFGLRNMRNLYYCPIFGQLVLQTLRQCCGQHANGWTIFGQCFVKLSNIWTVLCPTVQWLVYAVSNCPMACELSVQQSNGRTVLFPTFQWSDSPVSNFQKVR